MLKYDDSGMKKLFLYSFFLLAPAFSRCALAQGISAIRSSRIEVTAALDRQVTPQMEAELLPYKASADSVMAPLLGQSRVGMSAGRPESLLGNWAADAMVWAANRSDSLPHADFGLMNVGGLRNNMPKGNVRRGDILLISPFINRLAICELTGDVVMELLENIASVGGEAVSSEVRMAISKDHKLVSATIGGEPVDRSRTYRLATIDYLAEGNDKMTALKKSSSVLVTPLLASDVMMECVREHGTIDSRIEGRVTIDY